MSVKSVPEVKVDACNGYKFIVAKLIDGNGAERLVVRADENCEYHKEILSHLRREVSPLGLRAYCVGGGQIRIDPEAKTIQIWDSSGDFGAEPDRNQTVRMLQGAFPEYQVTRS